jgi:hypothetical protein
MWRRRISLTLMLQMPPTERDALVILLHEMPLDSLYTANIHIILKDLFTLGFPLPLNTDHTPPGPNLPIPTSHIFGPTNRTRTHGPPLSYKLA